MNRVSPNRTYAKRTPPEATKDAAGHKSRMRDAKALYDKGIEHLANSRNLKTEIKQGVQGALDQLYALVKDMDRELTVRAGNNDPGRQGKSLKEMQTQTETQGPNVKGREQEVRTDRFEEEKAALVQKMEEHASLMRESLRQTNNLMQVIEQHRVETSEAKQPIPSYASVAAVRPGAQPVVHRTLHSVAITSGQGSRSAEETFNEVREALQAREGGVEVERVRKAKDGRIIISCRTEEHREIVKQKLKDKKVNVTAEDIVNKKPLIMITGVSKVHTDDDLFRALRNQNRAVFEGLEEAEDWMEVAYKINGRNPNTHRVVLKTTPALWKRLTETGYVKIDLQTLQVKDRSPLTQCTICLGFGHGRRLCMETQVICSHCGGPHIRGECTEYTVGAPPTCKNCVREKRPEVTHNAFSEECPVRARWDVIARATVAYS